MGSTAPTVEPISTPAFSEWDDSSTSIMESFCRAPALEMLHSTGLFPPCKALNILDNACGAGMLSELMLDGFELGMTGEVFELALSDMDDKMVQRAKKRLESKGVQADVQCADSQNLPFKDATFDAVLTNMAIQLMPEGAKAIKEAHRVLVPSGTFAYTAWQRHGFLASIAAACPSFVPPKFLDNPLSTVPGAISTLEEIGFEDVKAEVIDTVLEWESPEETVRQVGMVGATLLAEGREEAWLRKLKDEFGEGKVTLRSQALVVTAKKA
ncbi:hypothetical protein JCM5296_001932 [Sporobolomyces johnsonii]